MRTSEILRTLFDTTAARVWIASVTVAILIGLLVPLFFAVASGSAQTESAGENIPDTPAGRTLQVWLDTFNGGERSKMEAFIERMSHKQSVDAQMAFRAQTGGFDLLSIESSEPLLVKFRVKEKASSTVAFGSLQVSDVQPPAVENFDLHAIPPGAVIENIKLDSAERQRVIDGVISNLNDSYVYAELAQKMGDALGAHQKTGDYDAITDGVAFASLLQDHLQAVSHDLHLRVDYSPYKLPPQQNGPSPDQEAQYRKQMERINCGFEKIEILPHNIGYLKFNMFADSSICGPTATAAMNFLGRVDAIIFDLRENGGGDPSMIALICTYLFDGPTHLNDLYNRKDDKTQQYWTLPYVPGNRLPGKPVFVLTSKSTFSGAEEFSYDLKNLKRATIVGETTGGGAHPVSGHRIDDHFMVGVPFARAINPVSKTNWEGVGVAPDVPVNAADALSVAQKLAEDKLQLH